MGRIGFSPARHYEAEGTHDESRSHACAPGPTGIASTGTNHPRARPSLIALRTPQRKVRCEVGPLSTRSEQPEPGKALVYVIEVFQRPPGELGTPTIRVGLNGKWVGANRGTSYLSFPADAGENHLCTNWQSVQKQLSSQHSLTSFVAEAGETYFFRVQTHFETYGYGVAPPGVVWSFDLQPMNSDEAKNFIAASPLSISQPKR